MLGHMVYFTLHDASPAAIQQMIAQCHELLSDHPGTVFFGAGGRTPDLNRPVNDAEFHVALHVVFTDRAAHDAYQVDPRHKKFIEQNRDKWKQVRVFDSDL